MKVDLLKTEERERNQSREIMRRMKEAWDDIYKLNNEYPNITG